MENTFPTVSPLIDSGLASQLKDLLNTLNADIRLTCILDSGEKSLEMADFLNHLTGLSSRVSCVFLNPEEAGDLAETMDASLLPSTGIGKPGEPPRMIFHGIPGGKEISSFATALLNAGQAVKPLDKYTLKEIAKVRKPLCLQVCVSLACQHCAQLAANAMRTAFENPMITAHTIDANLYPELVTRYNIQRVPLLVVDGDKLYPGGKSMGELTSLLYKIK